MTTKEENTQGCRSSSSRNAVAGFTLIEMITVIILIGILGAVGATRFFDKQVFAGRAYADQAKAVIRYAQKLAIAQNRNVFVRSEPNGFAVCFAANCGAVNALALAPGGSNSGSSASKSYCTLNSAYVATWMCEGKPTDVTVSTTPVRNELAAGGFFYFDSMGRPYNRADAVGSNSTFATSMVLTFSSGNSAYTVTVEPETGYVH